MLKLIIDDAEANEDGESCYQDVKLKRFLYEKGYTVNHAVEIVKSIWNVSISALATQYQKQVRELSMFTRMKGVVSYLMSVKFLTVLFGLIRQK